MNQIAPTEIAEYSKSNVESVLLSLQSSIEGGLSSNKIPDLLLKHGKNILMSPKPRTFWDMLWAQLSDLLVILLMISAVVSFALAIASHSHWQEYIAPVFIILIVIANSTLG
jgi:magnesium-transporting ATPase (P-type)